ncbi:hypothetical protein [uncultured Campylobacter sp.]|uniref:hypothetical protein n=1 Tax=uncultured Campylobacter sp. TaxID=218934 RepID=UPI0028E74C0C|nr:hypothetical protein [uncultured Campylobacter sp.]
MIKYIIGGVALLAIGYGLKTYADEYGLFDETSDEKNKEVDLVSVDEDESEEQEEYSSEYAAGI